MATIVAYDSAIDRQSMPKNS